MCFYVLSPRQKRLMAAVCEYKQQKSNGERVTMEQVASKHEVSTSTLCRACKADGSARSILSQSDGRGRRRRLTDAEEAIIVDAAIEFQRNGVPLDRQCLAELTKTLISTFDSARIRSIGFPENLPGKLWIRSFLHRHPQLTLRRRVQLEADRADAMNPENVATHFARLHAICEKHSINDSSRIINLDESGFSLRGMTIGRAKCIVKSGTRGNTRELKFRGSCDHVTLMPVVSAAGQVFTPLFVLPGKEARWRKRCNGKYETPSDFLPKPNLLFMRPIAGVDTNIFFEWAQHFIKETATLRAGGKILLVMDGFSAHISFRTLQLLADNGIVVIGLPAHTSHVLQPLDMSVFGPLKERFRRLLSTRTVTTTNDARNDIFTVCELLRDAYHTVLIPRNVIAGFRVTGIWNEDTRSCDPNIIRAEDLTSSTVRPQCLEGLQTTRSVMSIVETSNQPGKRLETCLELCALFKQRAAQLTSDGVVEKHGTIQVSTTSGATLTSSKVLSALREREIRQQARQQAREAAQELRETRACERQKAQAEALERREQRVRERTQREEEEARRRELVEEHREQQRVAREREKQARMEQRAQAARDEAERLRMRSRRADRLQRLSETRDERRRKARARAIMKS